MLDNLKEVMSIEVANMSIPSNVSLIKPKH
jgi:hypothetical protein